MGVRRSVLFASLVTVVWSVGVLPAAAAAGDVDASFAGSGALVQSHATTNRAPVVPGASGRLVIAWSTTTDVGVSGFLADGVSDGGYGTGGSSSITVAGASSVETTAATTDPKGRTLVSGFVSDPAGDYLFVARFTATGQPDATFSGDGFAGVAFSKGESYAYDLRVLKGSVYAVGEVYTGPSTARPAVVRLDGHGQLDPAFGSGGRKIYDVTPTVDGDDFFDAAASTPDGNLILGGAAAGVQGWDSVMTKIRPDGRPVRSFGDGGTLVLPVRPTDDDVVQDLAADGSRIVAGIRGNTQMPIVVRLKADGSRDATFGRKGIGRYRTASSFDLIAIAVDAHHRIYAVAYDSHLPVMRVRSDGKLSTGFGDAGVATNQGLTGLGSDLYLQGDLIVASGTQFGAAIVATRYLP